MSSGSLTLTDTDATSHAQSVDLSGGSLSGAGTLEVSNLSVGGTGELSGTGTVAVADSFDWTGGSMTGSGTTELAQAATGLVHPPTPGLVTLKARTLRSAGTLTFSSGRVEASQGALIDNSGTLSVDTEDGVSGLPSYAQPGLYDGYFGARSRLHNSGTFRKANGTGSTPIGPQFDNHGDARADTGKLVLTGGGIPDAGPPDITDCAFQPQLQDGTWAAASGAEVDFAGGCYRLGGNTQIAGDVRITGAYVSAPDIQGSNSTLSISAGKLLLTDRGATSQLESLNLSGSGQLTGDGDVAVGEDCSWTGGTMSGSGSTIVGPAASCAIDPGSTGSVTLTRGLVNGGDVTWASGSVSMGSGAVLVNDGVFHANAESVTGITGDGSVLVVNAGMLKKDGGDGTTTINVPVDNPGTIQVGSGTLRVQGEQCQLNSNTGDDTNEDPPDGPPEPTATPPDFSDPSQAPGDGWEWRGQQPPGGPNGAWFNPQSGESWHPDLDHPEPIGPHWDYNRRGEGGSGWRLGPDGTLTPKKSACG